MHSKSIGVAALSPPNRALEQHKAWAFQTPVLVLSRWAPAKYALVGKHLVQLHLHHEGMTIQTQLTLVAG